MIIPTIDFETYSEAGYKFDPALGRFLPLQKGKPGIASVNASVYAAHPSTELISVAYDLGKGTRLWIPGMPPPKDLIAHIVSGGLIEAHNSGFEHRVWNHVAEKHFGCGLSLNQLRCSASKARAWGLPGALDTLSKILDSKQKKDPRGKQLIRLLSIPQKPSKKHPSLHKTREEYPDLYREMYEYNIQDVESEKLISAMLPELSPFELRVWQLDQRINYRGVQIDTSALADAIEIYNQAEAKYTAELQSITGGAVNTVGEITKRSAGDKWLQSMGVDTPSLDKQSVEDMLEYRDMPDVCRRVLEIRQTIGGANAKKLFAMERCVSTDGRLRDLFVYCGAERTGRWSGSGSQPQNLKNSGPPCTVCTACGHIKAGNPDVGCDRCNIGVGEFIEWGNDCIKAAIETISTRNLEAVEDQWGNAVDIAASCLRGLFVAAPDHDLICSDYSAIEAVVLAALAGEEWRLEVFRTHGKIYEASASMAFGVSLEDILEHKAKTGSHHELRKKGKIQELANGYGGWINSSKVFGHPGSDDEIKKDILAWRDKSPMIVEFWGGQWRKTPGMWRFDPELYGLEGAAVSALMYPGQCFSYRSISYGHDTKDDVLYCLLPSGRKLAYHQPRLVRGVDPRGLDVWNITFMGWNSDSLKGLTGWQNMQTWGARMTENVVQATARDILAAALLRVEDAGYHVVLHVHDEIISEVPKGFGSVEEFERLMMVREPWFADWPIRAAGGWRGHRYRK